MYDQTDQGKIDKLVGNYTLDVAVGMLGNAILKAYEKAGEFTPGTAEIEQRISVDHAIVIKVLDDDEKEEYGLFNIGIETEKNNNA